MKNQFLAVLAICLGTAFAEERPNVFFIFSDDHALEAISAYGERFDKIAPTPNIDRIAAEGLLFERSYCGNSICGPSRASILTGKHSHLNGFIDNDFSRFDGSQPTFPKMLQKVGYETAVIGKWHLGSNPTGFDHWEVLPNQGSYYNPDFIQMDGTTKRFEGYVTDLVAEKSMEWLKNRKDKSKPFFLMSQHKAPHRNWIPAERHMNLFDEIEIPEPTSLFDRYENRVAALAEQRMSIAKDFHWSHDMLLPGSASDLRFADSTSNGEYTRMSAAQRKTFDVAFGAENQAFIKKLRAGMSDEELTRWKYQRYIKNYLRSIRALDENIGRTLDYLEESGLAKNTIVIYSSDQGFYLGEHGWYDKRWMFEESLAMPFIIRWPGKVKAGTRSKAMIQNIDYAPTFLEIAGVSKASDMQGDSLLPVLNNEGKAPENWRTAVHYQYSGENTHKVAAHQGVRNERYKLMHFPNTNEWMLFDLEKNPLEMENLAGKKEYNSVFQEMRQLHAKMLDKYQVNRSTYPKNRLKEKWWAKRWKQKNQELYTPAAKAAKLVFIGDSITQGWEGPGKAAWNQHFAPLGALNWGYSSDRSEHLIWRLQNGDIQRVSPEAAVLLIGTNNTGHEKRAASETASGIRRSVEELSQKWPKTKIIVMALFPRGESTEDPLCQLNSEINQQLQVLADQKQICLLDINSTYLGGHKKLNKDLFPDLLHLSPAAYDIWAEALREKLTQLGVE